MKTMTASKFRVHCLKTLSEVARTGRALVITKRGRPVAKIVSCTSEVTDHDLTGSVLAEAGDPFSTGGTWRQRDGERLRHKESIP